MKSTIEYIQAHFDAYNRQFFGGQLPTLPIKLSHAKGFLGKVTFVRRRQWLFGPLTPKAIGISGFLIAFPRNRLRLFRRKIPYSVIGL